MDLDLTMIRNTDDTEKNIDLLPLSSPERKSSLCSDVPVNSNIKPMGSEGLSTMEESDITKPRNLCIKDMSYLVSNWEDLGKCLYINQQKESKKTDNCMSADRKGFDIPELDRNSDSLKYTFANYVLTGPFSSWADIIGANKDQCCGNLKKMRSENLDDRPVTIKERLKKNHTDKSFGSLMKMWREHLDGKPVINRVCLKENHTDKGLVGPDNFDKLVVSVANFVLDEEI